VQGYADYFTLKINNMTLKIFELRWNEQGEKEWVAAFTNIGALKSYCEITSTDLVDMDGADEIVEVPEEEWANMTIKNTDFDPDDPDDKETQTFSEWMDGRTEPDIIAGTMYL
jgi:hypothetical protein